MYLWILCNPFPSFLTFDISLRIIQ